MPKHQGLWSLPCVIAALLFGAPALAEDAAAAQTKAKPYPEGVNCIWSPNQLSQSYYVIDDQHLVIEQPFKKRYLLTLTRVCWNLDVVNALRFTARGNQLCGPGDSVITNRDRCMIAYLEEVPTYDAAKTIVADRKAAEKAARESKASNGN